MNRILLFAACLAAQSVNADLASQVVIVANRNLPESVSLAQHYAVRRGIETNRILLLDLPAGEAITRPQYESRLRDPLLAAMRANGWIKQVKLDESLAKVHESGWSTVESSVKFIVPMWGVPVRIADDQLFVVQKMLELAKLPARRDGAAVDSELAVALFDHAEIAGPIPNPAYANVRWADLGENGSRLLIVSRLDAPSPEIVRQMIDDTIAAEEVGLQGRVYVDIRKWHDDGYRLGDVWMENAGYRLKREGFDTVFDRLDESMPSNIPMVDPAVYLGWYEEHVIGPFLQSGFRFRPGAIAYHLHSSSAKELRSATNFWVGPLLARGAVATMGSVYEPYLGFLPNWQLVIDRLADGQTYGESAYLSLPVLSWHVTVIGDPLYRPFRSTTAAATNDIATLAWQYVRRANLALEVGQMIGAIDILQDALKTCNDPAIHGRLAELFMGSQVFDQAIEHFVHATMSARSAAMAYSYGTRAIVLLRRAGRHADAESLETTIREKWPDEFMRLLLEQARRT